MTNQKITIGIIGIIAIIGLIIMFTNNQNSTGHITFDGLGKQITCKELTNALTQQAQYNPEFQKLHQTYQKYTMGIPKHMYTGKQNCITFFEFAKILNVKNILPQNNIEYCCYE